MEWTAFSLNLSKVSRQGSRIHREYSRKVCDVPPIPPEHFCISVIADEVLAEVTDRLMRG